MRLIATGILVFFSMIPPQGWAEEIPMIDAHSQVPNGEVAGEVIRLMDRAGIRHAILSFRGSARLRDVVALARAHPGRITLAIKIKGRHWGRGSNRFYQITARQMQSGRMGAIGEALLYHAAKGRKAPEFTVSTQDDQFRHVLGLARQGGWPLIFHIEFRAAPLPARLMKMLEALLRDNRGMAFPLIHMAQLEAPEVARLIDAHPNVYFMTSHANTVTVRTSRQPWINMFAGDKLKPVWRDLLIRHAERFILSFDNVWPEHWGSYYLEQAALWRRALATLPREVAHKVAHQNAERLWNLSPVGAK